MRYVVCPVLLALALLSGCDQQEPEIKPVAVVIEPQPVTDTPDTATAAEPAPLQLALQEAIKEPVATPVAPKPAAKPKPVVEQKLEMPTLDLSLPDDLLQGFTQELDVQDHEQLLPELFHPSNEQPPSFSISGRLINDPQEENYFDSVEGAELQIEFRQ